MQQFVHFLKYFMSEVPLELLMGSALASGGLFWGQLEGAVSNPWATPGGYACFIGEFAKNTALNWKQGL